MDISFLIVTRNRPKALRVTLDKLADIIDLASQEVWVHIDGCEKTSPLINEYKWVQWSKSEKSHSASPARNILYKKASGTIFIGLDDDAHPISPNFIEEVLVRFRENKHLGILAFQEVRGIYSADVDALAVKRSGKAYVTNDFVGCGFAVSKKAYNATNGFPLWMDIYGEESAVAIEVLDAGYEIIYDYNLIVNHRVDVEKRKSMGRNYFRFEHQLKNVISFYLVYYPKPALKIAKTLFHNFRKYAIKDTTYFMSFMKVCGRTCIDFRKILKYRSPVNQHTINHKDKLAPLKY